MLATYQGPTQDTTPLLAAPRRWIAQAPLGSQPQQLRGRQAVVRHHAAGRADAHHRLRPNVGAPRFGDGCSGWVTLLVLKVLKA